MMCCIDQPARMASVTWKSRDTKMAADSRGPLPLEEQPFRIHQTYLAVHFFNVVLEPKSPELAPVYQKLNIRTTCRSYRGAILPRAGACRCTYVAVLTACCLRRSKSLCGPPSVAYALVAFCRSPIGHLPCWAFCTGYCRGPKFYWLRIRCKFFHIGPPILAFLKEVLALPLDICTSPFTVSPSSSSSHPTFVSCVRGSKWLGE